MPQPYLVIGLLLLVLVLTGVAMRRAAITAAMIYLGIGWVAGATGWVELDLARDGRALETLAEVAVILSLFTAGLKLREPMHSTLWRLPAALASLAMVVTVGIIALAAILAGAPVGAAVLLGAILAPTDPVLASDVQVAHPGDTNRLRFTLTGEAGLNDGTAFPLVLLGLGLIGLHPIGLHAASWFARDVVWAIAAGLASGALVGKAVGQLVVWLRRRYRQAVGYDDFLALGLVATSYGLALALHAYGFLAVFAAGLALRGVERDLSARGDLPPDLAGMKGTDDHISSHRRHAPAYMAAAVLEFNEQMERLGELALMLVTGVLLAQNGIDLEAILFALLLLFLVRPLAVAPLAFAGGMGKRQAWMVAWFGIRGIGSLYYLLFATNRGLAPDTAQWLMQVALCTVAVSVILHGLSVAPLMQRFAADRAGKTPHD